MAGQYELKKFLRHMSIPILKDYFENGVTPGGLFKAALVPTAIMFVIFMLFS